MNIMDKRWEDEKQPQRNPVISLNKQLLNALEVLLLAYERELNDVPKAEFDEFSEVISARSAIKLAKNLK